MHNELGKSSPSAVLDPCNGQSSGNFSRIMERSLETQNAQKTLGMKPAAARI